MLTIIVISLVINVYCEKGNLGTDIDYTVIAGEAERNKHDILNFLNQSKVKEKYKDLYQCLLDKLLSKCFEHGAPYIARPLLIICNST